MKLYWFWLAGPLFIASCTINKNVMLKTHTDYVYDTLFTDSTNVEYRLAPNDIISFQLFTNEGAMILEFTSGNTNSPRYFNFQDFNYYLDNDGYADLPQAGRVKLSGLTINEAQSLLEEKYVSQFNSPYAIVKVINRRVLVFPGEGGQARVVPLLNQNITVLEALALAGGISDRGNASKVKLIRRTAEGDKVVLMNLSTIEGLEYAQMTVQAGDVIYVEPVPEIASEIMRDLQPYFTIVTGLALSYAIIVKGF
jgi:polysaccharide biosynthesis/export protein